MKKPGRPLGPATPQALLRRAMTESAKISAKARKILEARLDVLMHTDMIVPTDTEEIISILQALNRSIESAGKLLIPRGTREDVPTEAPTPEKILQEITKGKQQR